MIRIDTDPIRSGSTTLRCTVRRYTQKRLSRYGNTKEWPNFDRLTKKVRRIGFRYDHLVRIRIRRYQKEMYRVPITVHRA
jgi:hypothetical protein